VPATDGKIGAETFAEFMPGIVTVTEPSSQSLPPYGTDSQVSWLARPNPPSVDELTTLQRRLVYEVSGAPGSAAILFCDHPTGITIGREGSRLQVHPTDAQLVARKLPIHFVPRGGGAMLHLPGQITCYPILPLVQFGISPGEYLRTLVRLTATVISASDVPAEPCENEITVRVRGRRVAQIGVAVRNGVSLFGIIINTAPDLEPFRDLEVDGDPIQMTSMQRETTARISPYALRQKLLNALCDEYSLRRETVPNHRPIALLHLKRHAFAHHTG
jgi:lipoyl(octanoyl) transferase